MAGMEWLLMAPPIRASLFADLKPKPKPEPEPEPEPEPKLGATGPVGPSCCAGPPADNLEPEQVPYCVDCLYFEERHPARIRAGLGTDGFCRRYPPRYIESLGYSVFPEVDTTDWCGEWTREGKPLPGGLREAKRQNDEYLRIEYEKEPKESDI